MNGVLAHTGARPSTPASTGWWSRAAKAVASRILKRTVAGFHAIRKAQGERSARGDF
jgi:hypothetical protein